MDRRGRFELRQEFQFALVSKTSDIGKDVM
jgi:hypothetical protein